MEAFSRKVFYMLGNSFRHAHTLCMIVLHSNPSAKNKLWNLDNNLPVESAVIIEVTCRSAEVEGQDSMCSKEYAASLKCTILFLSCFFYLVHIIFLKFLHLFPVFICSRFR